MQRNHTKSSAKVLTEPPDDYEAFREILLEKPPIELKDELPKLIEMISQSATEDDDITRFLIGVSFTKNGTCFDYWVTEVIQSKNDYVVRTRKDAINRNHYYVTFYYPPDYQFDAASLRACLLSTIEREMDNSETEDASDDEGKPPFNRLRSLLPGF